MHPVITIFCAFTRYWAVERWLENLSALKHDPKLTNLAVIIDIDDVRILRALSLFAEQKGYRNFVYRINEDWEPNEVRIAVRRQRIAEVKNQSKDLINKCDGDIIICFEDDTVFDKLDLWRLIEPIEHSPEIGFVQGVQCGRWGVKMIGAWAADNPHDPQHIQTLLPKDPNGLSPYEDIDAGGWYGYATRKSLYVNCDYYTSPSQPWGPDVNFGLWLRSRGLRCLIDWSSIFGHNDHNVILYPDSDIAQISYNKDTETGLWARTDTQEVSS